MPIQTFLNPYELKKILLMPINTVYVYILLSEKYYQTSMSYDVKHNNTINSF